VGALTEDEKPAGAAELRGVARDHSDLLAEVAGIALGTSERRGHGDRIRAWPGRPPARAGRAETASDRA
jgi:hypothetical protein